MNKRTMSIAIAYFLVTISIVTCYPTLFNHIINWNDGELFSAVARGNAGIFSRPDAAPLTMAFLVFQRSFSDYGYFLFHALSMIFHAANAVLLFFIIRRLFHSDRLALIVSILFAVHSTQVETVAWLSMQSIVTSTFFLLLLCLSYLRYRQDSKSYYWGICLVCSGLFYLTSTPALTPVLLLLGIDLVIDSRINWAAIKQKKVIVLFWAAAFLFEIVRKGGLNYVLQLVYDSVAMVRLGMTEQIIRTVYPIHDVLVSSVDEIAQRSLILGEPAFPFVLLILAAFILWNRKRSPVIFSGFMFFTIMSLAIITGRADGDWALSDHSFYFSSIGLFLIVARLIDAVFSNLEKHRGVLRGAYLVCGCAVLALAYRGRTASGYWKDNVTFWNEAHEENPNNSFILTKRGMYYYSKFEIKKSLADLNKVVELAPDDEQAYLNLGLVHLDARYLDSAIVDFTKATTIRSEDPTAFYDLGIACNRNGKFDSAKSALSKAIALNPSFSQALNSRANAFAKTGNYVLAFADYHRALTLDTEYAEAYGNRAFTFLQSGNYQNALVDFRRQIDLAPNRFDAKVHCGFTELLAGDTAAAVSHFSSAMKDDSANGRMYLLAVSKVFLRSQKEIQAGQRLFDRMGVQ